MGHTSLTGASLVLQFFDGGFCQVFVDSLVFSKRLFQCRCKSFSGYFLSIKPPMSMLELCVFTRIESIGKDEVYRKFIYGGDTQGYAYL